MDVTKTHKGHDVNTIQMHPPAAARPYGPSVRRDEKAKVIALVGKRTRGKQPIAVCRDKEEEEDLR